MPSKIRSIEARLRQEIIDQGDISLSHFWREAMTAADSGYYTNTAPIGEDGDFITAPEVSQIFGELIGLWLADNWAKIGSPPNFDLVELGPGRGQLMVDALRATKSVPGFLSAAQLLLVEVSKPFRAMQADRLKKYSPSWQKDWQKITDGDAPLFLIANEFLDALPICQFELSSKGWEERRIIWNGHAFEFNNTLTANPPETKIFPSAPIGAVVEVSEERDALVDAVSKRIARTGGAALFIDYGFSTNKLGDSLQAILKGKPVNPLSNPGLADLTSHVNFSSVADKVEAAGAVSYGPVDQGVFLLRLGAEVRANQLAATATAEKNVLMRQSLKRLVHPLEMGGLFKALAILPPGSHEPAGFD
jgi:NADH dehydrogenase [ubiquinone] 1 alpha subcomplex assembly factor 7